MKKLIWGIVLCSTVCFMGCTDPENAKKALQSEGYSNIVITGFKFAPLACGKGKTRHTGFTATSKEGKDVSGVVCQGALFGDAKIELK